jgi:hypothetical protein
VPAITVSCSAALMTRHCSVFDFGVDVPPICVISVNVSDH